MLKTNQRARAFYYIALSSTVALINNMMKVAYNSPRPFWEFPGVWPLYCQEGFGCPSGHTMYCIALPTAIALDLKHSNPHGKLLQIVALLLTLFFGYEQAWTRVVLGVHTIDQVLMGALVGLWIAFSFEYIIRRPLMDHIMRLNLNKPDELYPKTSLAIIATLLTAVWLGFELIYYWATMCLPFPPKHEYIPPDPNWLSTINAKCNPNNNPDFHYQFASFEVPEFGEVGIPYGAYIGILLQTQLFGGRKHFQGPTQKKGLKLLGRAIGFLIIALPIRVLLITIDADDKLVFRLFFQVFLPSMLITLLMFGFMD